MYAFWLVVCLIFAQQKYLLSKNSLLSSSVKLATGDTYPDDSWRMDGIVC